MLLKNRVYFVCNTILIFLLFGCMSSNKNSEFRNLVFSKSCKSACWMGIEPKVTTDDETIAILERGYGTENVTKDSGFISWNIDNPDWNNRGNVLLSDNKVSFVMVWFPENYMEVKDIIFEIGSPASVGLVISGPDIKCAAASLVYPDTGLLVGLSPIDKSVGVRETQVIDSLFIHPPWTAGNYPWTDTEVVPWDGYHEYCPEKWPWEK